MPSNWLVFDRIRAFTRQNRIFQFERNAKNQSELDKIVDGDFLDSGNISSILDQTNLQINRLERYKDYEQMDQVGEISLALDLFSDESALVDPERKHTLIIRAKTRRIKRELEDLFYNILQWDTHCRPTARYLCKYGDAPFEIVLDANRTSVAALRFMSVYNFTRIETKYGDLVGFYYMDQINPKPQFLHPWQVMHLRLTSFECLYAPYGRSVIDGGRKAAKQLRLIEDAALIYRLTNAPERRKYTIPVGNIPAHEVPEYLQSIVRNFKRQRFYNPTTGTFDERYSPMIADDNIVLPRRPDGTGPDVELMQGGENVDKIADIEYFKKKMIAPTKIPFSRVGIGDGAGEASEKSLSQSSSEFAKSVQWVQREIATGLTKVAIVHLALRGFKVDDLKGFEIALTSTSAMEELYRIETWQTRASVMAELKDLGWFPKEWIVTHFTDLSPDEIEELKEMESEANNVSDDSGGGGGGLGSIGDLDGIGDTGDQPDEEEDIDILSDINQQPDSAMGSPPLEGYDVAAEKRVLNEQLRFEIMEKKRLLIERWMARQGKSDLGEEQGYNNGFDYFISTKELDGLTKGYKSDKILSENINGVEVYNPNDEAGLLVEWSVSEKDRREAMEEVLAIIMEDQKREPNLDSTEITENDLPI